SDETVFQISRAIVIGEVQSITFNEFLPALLGPSVIPNYSGYNPNLNPGIATEFSTAGFRLGHSLLAPDVQFLNPDGSTKFPTVSLANSFFGNWCHGSGPGCRVRSGQAGADSRSLGCRP